MEPKVTFLISVYNTPENQLRLAIESVLAQDYKNYDILIIDDGAKDNSVQIINSFKSDKIKIIHNNGNLGLEKSLNKGIDNISSKYIARMDTDDVCLPNRLKEQVDFAEKHTEYSIIGTAVNLFDENGIYGQTKKTGEIRKDDLLFGTPFIHPSMLIRTEDIKSIGGYPLFHRCEDYAMVMEMYSNGKKGYIMPEILLNYRMDKNGYNKRKFKDRLIEVKVKWIYFRKMKIPVYKYFYIFKPLLLIIIPKKLIMKYHQKKFKKEDKNG